MPHLVHATPKYRKHKPSGQARVTLDGRDFYLGPYGSKASRAEYDRLVGEWLANNRRMPAAPSDGIIVTEVISAFWKHAKAYYRKPDGTPTSELAVYKSVLHLLKVRYGHTPAVEFGPLALTALSLEMIRLGWVRKSINKQLHRIKRVFRWAAGQQLIPGSCYQALATAFSLPIGRTDAKESAPIRPVSDDATEAVRQAVSSQIRAMIDMQRYTAMRPGEVCAMRGCDIDRSGGVWVYKPAEHKNSFRGHTREVLIGPKAQAVLSPFLKDDDQAYIFAPADAVAENRAKRSAARVTPLEQGNAPGTNRKRRPKRTPTNRYTTQTYRRAIERGCERAFGMPDEFKRDPKDKPEVKREKSQKRRAWHAAHKWAPNRLRHTAGTNIRQEFGVEAASVILGHKSIPVSELYAEKNVKAAKKIMAAVG